MSAEGIKSRMRNARPCADDSRAERSCRENARKFANLQKWLDEIMRRRLSADLPLGPPRMASGTYSNAALQTLTAWSETAHRFAHAIEARTTQNSDCTSIL